MRLTRNTSLDRSLAIAIISAVLVLEAIVLWTTNVAARLEFTEGVRSVRLQQEAGAADRTPYITAVYRQTYKYSWWWYPVGFLWACWVLRRKHCSLLAILYYVGVSLNIVVSWFLFTLLALYVGNQLFYT
jgi:hypothetical protein